MENIFATKNYTFLWREYMNTIIRFLRDNSNFFIIAFITMIFSIIAITSSIGDTLKYSYPSAGIDYSSILWTEVPIDENGKEFSFTYTAWDLGQIGLRMSYDDINDNSMFELHIIDSKDNEQVCEYRTNELNTDSDGVTWLSVNQHVEAGLLKLIIKNINTKDLKVIAYSQEGVYDENGEALLSLYMKINAASFPKSKAYLFSVAWIIIILAGIIIIKRKAVSYEKLFVISYLVLGVLAFMVFTPFNEADSGNHYRRAYAISEGVFFPEIDENNEIGGVFAWPSTWGTGDGIGMSWYEAKNRIGFDVTDPANSQYLTYTNIALYSPICHLVPALAIKITRLFSHSIIIIEMFAKLLNYLVIGLVLYFGIKITPFGKEYFLWIILHPFMMKQYTSLSPDILTAALIYLITALVLRLRYDPDVYAKKGYLAALYVISFLIGQFKIVYIVFALVLFLIPVDKFRSRKNYIFNVFGIGSVTIIPALIWLRISSNILRVGYSDTYDTNKKIVLNVIKYVPVLLKTVFVKGYECIMDFFGFTLVFKDGTNNTVVLIFIMLITALIVGNVYRSKSNESQVAVIVRKDIAMKTIIFVAIGITIILIFTAEYIQWTDPGSSIVYGVQGRYFFPFMFPALIAFAGMGGTKNIDGEVVDKTACIKLFSLASVMLCFIAQLYIVYQL